MIKTPDDTIINFKYISRQEAKELLAGNDYKVLPDDQLDFLRRKAYLLSDQKVLYEIEVDGNYFLVDEIDSYKGMVRGKRYFQASFIIDKKNSELYSSYNLRSYAAKEYFDKKIKLLERYTVFEGYHAYLIPDNSIAFLRHRINDIFDGYWYPSIQVFEHEYFFLTTNKYGPDLL